MCLCLDLWGFLPKGSTFTKHLLEHGMKDNCCPSPVTTTEVLGCTWPCLAAGLQSIWPAVKRNKCTDKVSQFRFVSDQILSRFLPLTQSLSHHQAATHRYSLGRVRTPNTSNSISLPSCSKITSSSTTTTTEMYFEERTLSPQIICLDQPQAAKAETRLSRDFSFPYC